MNSGIVFILEGDLLQEVIYHKHRTTDSPESRMIITFLDDLNFDLLTKTKNRKE